ncbi:ABC transporter substrate-binding protein [Microbacterium sp. EST19A]|uniref:ABC transporter substrate-binding protein n=1 Tax=Microbacterium sp. EST19A TaxID=2862681 RepID=UPI001CBACF0C|nr:extracellular solute-binding protein [Microbacterium sp. EST19A]
MRHNTRRVVALTAVSALGVVVLAGCSTNGGGGGGDETELRILANITPVLTKEYYQALVQPWVDEHEGVTVTIEVPSGENVQSTLQQELASGDVPDIVASNLDPVVAPQLLAFPDEAWVLDTPLAKENAVDDKIWQVATGAQIQSLVFYNKDLFSAAGVTEVPTSVEDFTAALAAVKAAGTATPLGTAGEWVTGAQFAMMSNPALLESGDFFTEVTDGDASFSDSPYAEYLDAYSGWISEGLVDPDALGLKYQDSIDAFTSGSSAALVMGNWLVPSIDDAGVDFEVGVFASPSLDGEIAPQMSGPAQPYSILQASQNQDLALSLVEYLVSDEKAVTASLESEGNFRQGYSYEGSALNQEVGAILDAAPGLVIGTSGPGIPGGFGDELNKQVQALYVGATPADAAAALDAWWGLNAAQ